ncbi:Transcription elongation factor SPT6 [Intoshia linei]|uniref:Transcription elongation factor SPT6 n=1 Tax=Intoshia linei TaxID=1819745 RepID=A0A177BCM4_9BILA|nr:Transcription elongation factor SPT6 [Intoshia linei]
MMSEFFDQEAELSSCDENELSQLSSDEEDDKEININLPGLINDDTEEEIAELSTKREKHVSSSDDSLSDEDLDLLEDNLGIKVNRKKKRRRIMMADDDEDEEMSAALSAKSIPVQQNYNYTNPDMDDSSIDEEIENFNTRDEIAAISKSEIDEDMIEGLKDAEEIFGINFDYDDFKNIESSDDDLEDLEKTKFNLNNIFEPYEMDRLEKSQKNVEISVSDIPERFQLRKYPVATVDMEEIEEEAEWIKLNYFYTKSLSSQDDMHLRSAMERTSTLELSKKICNVLKFIKLEGFDIPFIAFYRKEAIHPELQMEDLWSIYKYDEKWIHFTNRKKAVSNLFDKIKIYFDSKDLTENSKELVDMINGIKIVDVLKNLKTVDEIDDFTKYLLFYFGEFDNCNETHVDELDPNLDKKLFKRAKFNIRQYFYEKGFKESIQHIGMKPYQFAENLRDNFQHNDVTSSDEIPKTLFSRFTDENYDVIKGLLVSYISKTLSIEPLIAKIVRSVYFERALVDASVTKKGRAIIDESHDIFSMMYLTNKPISSFHHDQFWKLHQAYENGLIEYDIHMDNTGKKEINFYEKIKHLYLKDEYNYAVQEWNDIREKGLKSALYNCLYPKLKKEVTLKLIQEGKNFVVSDASRLLYNDISVAPIKREFTFEGDHEDDLRIFCLVYSDNEHEETFGVLCNSNGDVLQSVTFQALHVYMSRLARDGVSLLAKNRRKDIHNLGEFVETHKPHFIGIGATNRNSVSLAREIEDLVIDLANFETNKKDKRAFKSIKIDVVDQETCIAFSNSNFGKKELSNMHILERQAVSMCRKLLDPLTEISRLFNKDNDILNVNYSKKRFSGDKKELMDAYNIIFTNRVNEVGVDLNDIIENVHKDCVLQFVSGLGPRKASHILKKFRSSRDLLYNRTYLVIRCGIAAKIFVNCSGFIKLKLSNIDVDNATETHTHLLDVTRIHPEMYDIAKKIIRDVKDFDDEDEGENENDNILIYRTFKNAAILNKIDLNNYCEVEGSVVFDKMITLQDIKAEFYSPYQDLRFPYRSPNPDSLFKMTINETPETFCLGKLVTCIVVGFSYRRLNEESIKVAQPIKNESCGTWMCQYCFVEDFKNISGVLRHYESNQCLGTITGIRIRLENSLTGYIPLMYLSDNHISNPKKKVRIGMLIHARVRKIDVTRFSVEVTCRTSDLTDEDHKWKPARDRFYDSCKEYLDIVKDRQETSRANKQKQYTKRVIVHSLFKNVPYSSCIDIMSKECNIGDVMYRPSSKASDHLTATWKISENIYRHIDISEFDKTNNFSIGRKLKIENEYYEDLDEITARYIQPMASYIRDIVTHKYYLAMQNSNNAEIEKIILLEKRSQPSRIPYKLIASHEYPGKFILAYCPTTKTKIEYLTITVNGIRYRKKMFATLPDLLKWFKEHYRESYKCVKSYKQFQTVPTYNVI